MLHNKSFMRKTKSGKVLKVVREHYLREDLPCGFVNCPRCQSILEENSQMIKLQTLSPQAQRLLVVDTNVVIRQIDALEHPKLMDVVIPKVVEEEVRHLNTKTHSRLRAIIDNKEKKFFLFDNEHHRETFVERLPGETPNDRNDRAIRTVALWYGSHQLLPVILITNDRLNKEAALAAGVNALTVLEYANEIRDSLPEWTDMLVVGQDQEEQNDAFTKKTEYPEHKSKNETEAGLKAGRYYQGPLRMNRDNYTEGNVPVEGLEDEILIQGLQNLNRAVNGDIVAVQLLPKEQWSRPSMRAVQKIEDNEDGEGVSEKDQNLMEEMRPSGVIVSIIKRNWKPYCGTIDSGSNGSQALFVPVNRQIPKIKIHTRQMENLKNKRIVVSIDAWDKNSKYPSGHYVRTLGPVGDINVETEVIMIQHDICYHPFTESVMNCLPSPDWIAENDPDFRNPTRRDLRHENICSVDPPGCTDIDDALHIKTLPNGNYEVGVHIADVTHFVHQDSAIDKEAAERSTTVYLVNKRIDMLPKLLGENLCSLRSNVDRFTFSVVWELTPEAEVVSVDYFKATINSKASLTYEQAQMRIDDKRLHDDISVGLRKLNALAKKLKQRRLDAGALELASTEIKFIRDQESQEPLDVEMYQLRETNSMVEEFMLLANVWVAEKIYESFPNFAILRRHPTPPKKNFEPMIDAAGKIGINIEVESSKALAESLDRAVVPKDPFVNKLLRILTTRCMTQAVYFSSGSVARDQFAHYGLAAPIYTHFTSPIRRYADDIVHRLLGCCIGVYTLSMDIDNNRISKLCQNINFRHTMAQHASRSSTELHTVVFFRGRVLQEDGYITRVKTNGFSVLVPKYGIESMVYVNTEEDSKDFVMDKITHQIKSVSLGDVAIGLMNKVRVEISIDEDRESLRLKCIDPPIHKAIPQTQKAVKEGKSLPKAKKQKN